MATLLSICQGAADRVGMPRPTQVATSIDQTTRTLFGCAQEEGSELARRWAWQALLREKTFVSVAATAQTNSIPADWDGRMVDDTFWNRTQRRKVLGPLTSSEWQNIQASGVQSVTDGFRFRDDLIEIVPTPTAGWTYAYEYMTSQWCETSGGTGLAAWASDTDVARLDGELMTLGVVWRFLQGRGMSADTAFAKYEAQVMNAMARDGTRRIVSLSGPGSAHRARTVAVPDGSWNL